MTLILFVGLTGNAERLTRTHLITLEFGFFFPCAETGISGSTSKEGKFLPEKIMVHHQLGHCYFQLCTGELLPM